MDTSGHRALTAFTGHDKGKASRSSVEGHERTIGESKAKMQWPTGSIRGHFGVKYFLPAQHMTPAVMVGSRGNARGERPQEDHARAGKSR